MAGWLSRSFHRKLALAIFLITALGIAITSFVVGRAARAALESELSDSLTTTASIVNAEVDKALFLGRKSNELHARSHFLAEASGGRITFIAPDGTVLGDSFVPAGQLSRMDNHADRPEVRAALEGRHGGSVRLSKTTGERLLYSAVPAISDGQLIGVVRASVPLRDVEKKIARIQRRTAFSTLAVIAFLLVIALVTASSFSRPVREMSDVARRLAAGDYAARVQGFEPDEHGKLGSTLNLLAERVQSKIQELSHDKAQLAAILSNMTEAVVAVDSAGRILIVNNALSRMFAVEAGAAVGKMLLEVLRHNPLDELVRKVIASRSPAVDEIRTFTPEERVFEAQAVPLTEEGRFTGALVVLHDITRLRRLEQVRRDFVANVSHELRTPLASIKGFAETLEMGAVDDAKIRGEFLSAIQNQADRMTALVEDLLDLTAIESGQRDPIRQPVSLREVLDDVALGLRPLAFRRKVSLSLSVSPDLPSLGADRGQVRQVFVNLLENAVKFNREGGTVSVDGQIAGDMIEVRVVDTGLGIPAQDLPRVFERFYRVDKARSRDMGGTGLGLSIVKHIVEAHGGTVSADSTIGKGTTFLVRLPLYKPASA